MEKKRDSRVSAPDGGIYKSSRKIKSRRKIMKGTTLKKTALVCALFALVTVLANPQAGGNSREAVAACNRGNEFYKTGDSVPLAVSDIHV
jgi:hypothetical protein